MRIILILKAKECKEEKAMSKDWTMVELEAASQIMKASGNMSYEEFCEALDNGYFSNVGKSSDREEACAEEQS